MIIGLFAVSFVGLRIWLDSRPIQWVPYTTQAFNKQIGDGKPIVVLVGADWDVSSVFFKEVAFEDPKLTKVIRERSVVAFYADLTSQSPEVVSFLTSVERLSTPTVVVFPNGVAENPVVLDGLTSADQIIRAIKSVRDVRSQPNGGR